MYQEKMLSLSKALDGILQIKSVKPGITVTEDDLTDLCLTAITLAEKAPPDVDQRELVTAMIMGITREGFTLENLQRLLNGGQKKSHTALPRKLIKRRRKGKKTINRKTVTIAGIPGLLPEAPKRR